MARDFQTEYQARQGRARDAGFASYNEQRRFRAEASDAGITGNKRTDIAARDVFGLTMREPPSRARNRKVVKLAVDRGIAPRRILDLLPKYEGQA